MTRVLVALIVAACGDDFVPIEDDGGELVPSIDAALDECGHAIGGPTAGECDPLTRLPCATDEKCTWIVESVTPSCGHLGCAFAGELVAGSACEAPHDNVPDACARGLYCDGTCRVVCDLSGLPPICTESEACEAVPDAFTSGAVTVAGVCR